MKNYLIILLVILCIGCQPKADQEQKNYPIENAEEKRTLYRPEKDLGELFETIQLAAIFQDSKTFVDADPKMDPKLIVKEYEEQKDNPAFDLKEFVLSHFTVPQSENATASIDQSKELEVHLVNHWDYLTRSPDEIKPYSTLLPLPSSYIVPGGRFREIYYWDSYFTIIGLAASDRWDLVEGMTNNFAHLIDEVGFVPNGNRTYYLTRSQPPFFSSIVAIQMKHFGEEKGIEYLSQLEKEYNFWMKGQSALSLENSDSQHTVKLPDGEILNRYWDQSDQPRPESYREDVELAEKVTDKARLYKNLRSAAESGWDFSTRWFEDDDLFESIATTDIIPVDLNCLLYHLERTISTLHGLSGNFSESKRFQELAADRKAAILKYCWNKEKQYFADYNFKKGKVSDKLTLASNFPLYYKICSLEQARNQSDAIIRDLLKPQGLLTTPITSGQQWDAPNGWAPLQWITIRGFENYAMDTVAKKMKDQWMTINEKVYAQTGKMMEKYNMIDSTLVAGGGEYPTQDGFGWTNGVYLGLARDFSEY